MPFPDDERAVSQLIGALFVFAILIFSLVSYQAVIVPSQNKQVEFNHFEEVKDDFRDQRTALVNAGASGETRSASLNLGTRYPSRSIALNAAPASGTYETVQPGDGNIDTTNLDLANLCGLGSTVPVHHTVYRPDYNYLSVDSEQRYENTVYYQPTGGSSLLNRTEQIFIRPNGSGGTIDLYPLQDSFSRSGTRSTTVDFVGGDTGEITKSDGSYSSFTIDVPSRISESQWSNELLSTTSNVNVDENGDDVAFEFTGGDWVIQCHPVGVGEAPDQAATDAILGGGGSINPTGSGSLKLTSASENTSKDKADLTFNNTGDKKNATKIRVPFYLEDSGGARADEIQKFGGEGFSGGDLSVGGGFGTLNNTVAFAENTSSINKQIDFESTGGGGNVKTGGDFFILVVRFEDGQEETYFVAPQ